MSFVVKNWLRSIARPYLFPGSLSQNLPEANLAKEFENKLEYTVASDGNRIAMLVGEALQADGSPDPEASQRPTVVYFYGNGMFLSVATDEVQAWRHLGVNVIVPEYAGYGLSEGISSEAGLYDTAEAVIDWLFETRRLRPEEIIVAGWSMGAAVAINTAAIHRVRGLIALSPFTSLPEVARHLLPSYLPLHYLIVDRFDNLEKIRRVRSPAFFGHGQVDAIVPLEHSQILANAHLGPCRRYWAEQVDHNDFSVACVPELQAHLSEFIDSLFVSRSLCN